jgi:hypothetical protein
MIVETANAKEITLGVWQLRAVFMRIGLIKKWPKKLPI